MTNYTPPLKEIRFVIDEVLNARASWIRCNAFSDLDGDTAAQILEEGGRFAAGVIAPLNPSGDQEGCRIDGDAVRTPHGFEAAYRAFVDAGWPALSCDPEHGGQGLPTLLNTALYEMLLSANHAWTTVPSLMHGAYETIKLHGDQSLRERYLPRLASGEWLAAMALTEPQAGSDLGLITTRGRYDTDGSLRISGSKIFITGGDHDLTDNIVQLVLFRLPDAPPGNKGISLALVPKILPDGTRNGVRATGLEHKLGIHGSPTCQIQFDEATGWLVGEPNRGLSAMFVMMNSARLMVALQGLGHLEAATQFSLEYARERRQMRAPVRPESAAAKAADPIVYHPAMRKVLWSLRARVEAQRVIAYRMAQLIDESASHDEGEHRRQAATKVAILTPIVKSLLSLDGFQGSSDALQILGGYGYVRDYPVEQHLRDARIAMIYEGTNEIQAIDLIQRKVLADCGKGLNELLEDLAQEIPRCQGDALTPLAAALAEQCRKAREVTSEVLTHSESDGELPLRVADDYQMAMSYVLMCWAWVAIARAAVHSGDEERAQAKLDLARFGVEWLLPKADYFWNEVRRHQRQLRWV